MQYVHFADCMTHNAFSACNALQNFLDEGCSTTYTNAQHLLEFFPQVVDKKNLHNIH
jgi:hypothetical protein